MALTLIIENETGLANDAPLRVVLTEGENLDIGRGTEIDWCLPDPTRFISSKHCEIRSRDGSYWLYDVSMNGTFVNDDQRLQSPHRIRNGDRIGIGPYVILASLDGAAADHAEPAIAEPEVRPPFVITEVAPRASVSAFSLEVEKAARPAPSDAVHAAPENAAAEQRSADASVRGAGAHEQADFLQRFAAGAAISGDVFANRDPLTAAEELGALFRLVTANMQQLLRARSEARRLMRTTDQTMIEMVDNNPLKFAPTTEDALKIMLGQQTASYLDAGRAFEAAFQDLKEHQVKTFSAMQSAIRILLDDLDPQKITESGGTDSWLSNRKSHLWDEFVARWRAKQLRHSDGLLDAFMLYFAECYEKPGE